MMLSNRTMTPTVSSHAALAALHDAGIVDVLERATKAAAAALAASAADDLWMAWTGAPLDEAAVYDHRRRAIAFAGAGLHGPETTRHYIIASPSIQSSDFWPACAAVQCNELLIRSMRRVGIVPLEAVCVFIISARLPFLRVSHDPNPDPNARGAAAAASACAAFLCRVRELTLASGGLLDGLLRLHAALAVAPESLVRR